MQISNKGVEAIQWFESLRYQAYPDSAGIWTIGFGTTHYPNGTEVKEGDIIPNNDYARAVIYLRNDLQDVVRYINNLTWNVPLNQSQFDALCSFAYNEGRTALGGSTLYKKASVDPNDETIYKYNPDSPINSCEFLRWVKATIDGKLQVVDGLVNRRMKECDLYSEPL